MMKSTLLQLSRRGLYRTAAGLAASAGALPILVPVKSHAAAEQDVATLPNGSGFYRFKRCLDLVEVADRLRCRGLPSVLIWSSLISTKELY